MRNRREGWEGNKVAEEQVEGDGENCRGKSRKEGKIKRFRAFAESKDSFALKMVKSGQRIIYEINSFKDSHLRNPLFSGSQVEKSILLFSV